MYIKRQIKEQMQVVHRHLFIYQVQKLMVILHGSFSIVVLVLSKLQRLLMQQLLQLHLKMRMAYYQQVLWVQVMLQRYGH